jgi:hypothetical protein
MGEGGLLSSTNGLKEGAKLLRDFALRPSEEERLRSFAESLLQHGF